MTLRQQQIVDLWNQGYSIEAIAGRLGITVSTVTQLLFREPWGRDFGAPPGYVSLPKAARHFGVPVDNIFQAIERGELPALFRNRHVYITMEAVDNWLDNSHYHRQARALAARVLRPRPTPAE